VPLTHRQLESAGELRALAHPVRLRLLEELAVDGPLTATELAERIDELPANCSWHLRQLAKHHFVEEAGGGTGRRRPWRIVAESHSWGDSDSPAAAAAARALSDTVLASAIDSRRRFHDVEHAEPPEWRDAAFTIGSSLTWLTAAELAELGELISDRIEQYADRVLDPALRPEGARIVRLVAWGHPARPEEKQ